jgi:hypothetical protein
VYALDTPASIKALKDKPFTLKEGEQNGEKKKCANLNSRRLQVQDRGVFPRAARDCERPVFRQLGVQGTHQGHHRQGAKEEEEAEKRIVANLTLGNAWQLRAQGGALRVHHAASRLGGGAHWRHVPRQLQGLHFFVFFFVGLCLTIAQQAKSSFLDDDKAKHLEYEYAFKIAKEFDD